MAEKDITVTNAKGKSKEHKLDTDATLDKIRTKLAKFMKEDDFFEDKKGDIVTLTGEKKKKLSDILKKDTIVLKKQVEESDDDDSSDGGPVVIGTPEDKEPYTPDLTPSPRPEINWAQDNVDRGDGYDKSGKIVAEDTLTDLKVGQLRKLLSKNEIDLNKTDHGSAQAFVMAGDFGFDHGHGFPVRFQRVTTQEPTYDRLEKSRVTYSEFESQLYKGMVSESSAGVGVPEIFSVDASYRYSGATTTAQKKVTMIGTAEILVPKARVVLDRRSITLSEDFVGEVTRAVALPATKRAEELLWVLGQYGQFVATDIMLGGRVNFDSEKTLSESHDFESEEHTFKLATEARFMMENGMPVKVKGSTGAATARQFEQHIIDQASGFELKVMGGNANAVGPKQGAALGVRWMPTLRKYKKWKVVGFYPRSLVPIIQYLEPSLRFKCVKILKDYFTSWLRVRETPSVGIRGDSQWSSWPTRDDYQRIRKVEVNHDEWGVVGLRISYELKDHSLEPVTVGSMDERDTFGFIRKVDSFDVRDDELSQIEVLICDHNSKALAFKTTKGKRYPSTHYYGSPGDQKKKKETLCAPRVFGITGSMGWVSWKYDWRDVVFQIGLRYRELAEECPARDFLLAMEPYLFPVSAPYTDRGLLLVGNWATEDQLNDWGSVDKRNHLMTMAFEKYSNQPAAYWAGLSHDALLDKAAIAAFLKASGEAATPEWLKGKSDTEQYNHLIKRINGITDVPESDLRALPVPELINWGWAVKGAAKAEEARTWNEKARS